MVEEIKRQTAYICNIDTLSKGVFIKKQGWESNYIMTEYGDFSRVNIMAVIVGQDENQIIIDDGTGQISGRMFENREQMHTVNIGDAVIIIGRPREFNDKMYLTIELVKKIEPQWLTYRKKELLLIKKARDIADLPKIEKKIQEPEIIDSVSTMGHKDKLALLIKSLDKGSGANIEDVIRMSKISQAENIISDMMMRGEIFEVKAGHVKLM